MKTLRELIIDAKKGGYAIGHFNASNIEAVWAIFRAAKKLNAPVIVGFSEGERDFFGVRQAVAVIRSIRDEFDYPIFLNADHTYSFDRVKEAVEAGFDSVIFDGTELSFEENLKITRRCVEFAKKSGRNVIVEGELGFIGKSSKVLDSLPAGVKIGEEFLTKPDDARRFVEDTGIDFLAPSVGNLHGMLRSGLEPALNIERIRAISEAAGIPLVLHGASGLKDDDVSASIKAGISNIHFNTELRVAYAKGIQKAFHDKPNETTPYKYLGPAVEEVKKVVAQKIKVFMGR